VTAYFYVYSHTKRSYLVSWRIFCWKLVESWRKLFFLQTHFPLPIYHHYSTTSKNSQLAAVLEPSLAHFLI
jgi:hypothetical protein